MNILKPLLYHLFQKYGHGTEFISSKFIVMKHIVRIMILSPYDNEELRSHLVFKEYNGLLLSVIEKLGLSGKTDSFKDRAPWVGNLIAELENRPEVEVFSVSPQIKMREKIVKFKLRRTTYYVYSSDYSSALRLINNYSLWKFLQNCGMEVKRIAKEINPDIIILFGTENPVISAPVLSLTDYPVFCICQTVYNNPERTKYNKPSKLIQQLEMDILHHVDYYGTSNRAYREMLLKLNPAISILNYQWPSMHFPNMPEQEKCYDFVNFAFTMGLRKGDEDSIKALAVVKQFYPNVTLNITGGYSNDRKQYLEGLLRELDLEKNVSFTPFFEKHEDMIRHVMHARFAVLPIKLDLISTTIKEAMFYKIPVVTNRTKGTPKLNSKQQCVLLSDIGDIESLANNMLALLQNKSLAESLKTNAYDYLLDEQKSNVAKVDNLINILTAVYNNKHYHAPIPDDLYLK